MVEVNNWQKEHWIIALSAGLLIIGAFLTWVNSYLDFEGVRIAARGLSGITIQSGYATAGIGLLIIAIFFFKKIYKIITIILGFISLIFGLLYMYYIKYVPKMFIEVQGGIGIGLIITVIASIGIIIGGFMIKKK